MMLSNSAAEYLRKGGAGSSSSNPFSEGGPMA